MKKIILLIVLMALPAIALAQQPTTPSPAQKEPAKITIPTSEAKALKNAFDAAKQAAEAVQRANEQSELANMRLKALYWETVVKLEIDIKKFTIDQDESGTPFFIEKPQPPKVAMEEKKQ